MPRKTDTQSPILYKGQVFEVRVTEAFADWFGKLRDQHSVGRMAGEFRKLGDGNFGNAKPVGDGVHELRMEFGPGYRAYFINRNRRLILLLCGGDKSSQKRDIALTKEMAKGSFDDEEGADQTIRPG